MKRKAIGIVLASAMVASLFAGCGSSSSSTETADTADTEATSAAEETADAATDSEWDDGITYSSDEQITLVLEMPSTDISDWAESTLPGLVSERFPNITVEVTATLPSADYKSDVKMKFAAGEGPNLFTWWAGQQSSALVEAGYCQDISDLELLANFREDMVESYAIDGVNYGVPMGSSFLTTWYNKDMFEDAGITSEPTNWEEFLADCQALKDAGYTPIVMGDQDGLTVIQFGLYQMAASCVYADNPDFDYQLATGETKFTDDCWVEAVEKYQQLYDLGYVVSGSTGISQDQSREAFNNQEAAMIFDGSFGYNNLNGDDFERGMFCIPSNDEGETQVINLTPATACFASAQGTDAEQEASIAVMQYWFTEGTALFESWAEANTNIPCENSLTDSREDIQDYLNKYDGFDTIYNCNNEWPDGVSDAMCSTFQEVILGQASAEDVTQAMQSKYEEVTAQ